MFSARSNGCATLVVLVLVTPSCGSLQQTLGGSLPSVSGAGAAPLATTSAASATPTVSTDVPSSGPTPTAVAQVVGVDRPADPAPSEEDFVAPRPGVEKVVAGPPTWCPNRAERNTPAYPAADDDLFNPGDRRLEAPRIVARIKDEAHHPDWRWYQVRGEPIAALAWSACVSPADKNRHKWVAIGRQLIANAQGLNDAEGRQVLAAALYEERFVKSETKAGCAKLASLPAASATDAVKRDALLFLTGCDTSVPARVEGSDEWHAARRVPRLPSELATVTLVHRCLGLESDRGPLETRSLENGNHMATVAYCSHDLRRLDRAQAMKEIAAAKLPAVLAATAIARVAETKLKTDAFLAALEQATAKQAWLREVMVSEPERGAAEWAKVYAEHKDAVERVYEYEAKFRASSDSVSELKRAFAGCSPALYRGFAKYVRARKPKQVEAFVATATDPVGVLLASGVAACDAIEGRQASALAAKSLLLDRAVPVHGPRAAAYLAAAKRFAEVAADRSNLPFSISTFFPANLPPPPNWAFEAYDRMRMPGKPAIGTWTFVHRSEPIGKRPVDADGEVAALKKQGDGVLVSFKAVSYKQAMENCTRTNRVSHFEFSGGAVIPRYEMDCRPAGYETRVSQPAPMLVPSWMAETLKVGMAVRAFAFDEKFTRDGDGTRQGIPLEVYADKDRRKLASVFGVPVP